MYSLLTALSVPLLAGLAHGYANPGSCSGSCNVHDPALIVRESDGKYFRFSTGNEISYASASSINGPWTAIGSVVPAGSTIDLSGNTDLWAPDLSYVDGTYYCLYSVSTFGSQDSAIGVASSTTMELNTWTDHGSVGVASSSSKKYNAIDGNLLVDGSSYYLQFGSFWGDLYQVKMASPLKTAGSASYNIAYNATGTHSEEGSYLFKYGSYYYLFFSSGTCCGYDTSLPAQGEEYKIMVCRSTSATGGFVDKNGNACTESGGTIVLASHGTVYGPGGQGVYDDPTYGPVLYYHYVDTTVGYADDQKLFGWNTIDFSSGWPVV
ncbi:endo-alpha-1,5-arabinanase precursor [Aspergillus indologenus CBS 114.80]|uniref:Arabinan endo-1,5-alpha-L-arabinosidase n=1 Tax=Aspergillus indologenus CBS 114.80 TaxID=1450541 RepID=A0A2V5IE37_9EURO|nr:endo-alpha-1,5-arabinanase precursor [Aspergillus indologenus CBS 114.80]